MKKKKEKLSQSSTVMRHTGKCKESFSLCMFIDSVLGTFIKQEIVPFYASHGGVLCALTMR
jgi:hypothetical protein